MKKILIILIFGLLFYGTYKYGEFSGYLKGQEYERSIMAGIQDANTLLHAASYIRLKKQEPIGVLESMAESSLLEALNKPGIDPSRCGRVQEYLFNYRKSYPNAKFSNNLDQAFYAWNEKLKK
jgi:hypothetical protein